MKSDIALFAVIGIVILIFLGWLVLRQYQGWESTSKNLAEEQVTSSSTKESDELVILDPSIQELGTVVYGEIATTTFTLTNSTTNPLVITRLSTSCGCTKAEAEKKTLAPHEKAIINVSFDPAVHKDGTDLGEVSRTIFIETDNLDFPLLEANITARVVKK